MRIQMKPEQSCFAKVLPATDKTNKDDLFNHDLARQVKTLAVLGDQNPAFTPVSDKAAERQRWHVPCSWVTFADDADVFNTFVFLAGYMSLDISGALV